MREKRKESLAEVSGAVEIDVSVLTQYERGISRPSEDILMLLMSHFALKDEDALKIWDLAGYGRQDDGFQPAESAAEKSVKQVMVLPMDARVVYTDMAHIVVNKNGIVLNFMQEAGLGGQPLAVARLGMSKEHAQNVVDLLQKALNQTPKYLPAPDQKNQNAEQ